MSRWLASHALGLAAVAILMSAAPAVGQSAHPSPPASLLLDPAGKVAATRPPEDQIARPSGPARTQPPASRPRRSPKWALEVHGGRFGSLLGGSSDGGNTIDAFPAGASFTTAGGQPSRAVSSWFFGDGPVLFDEIRASFAANYAVALGGISPLDGMLRTPGTSRTPGNAFGARLSRDLTSWLGIELAYDQTSIERALSDTAATAIEASRASYVTAFQSLLATIPQTGGAVTATSSSLDGASKRQMVATASVVVTPVRSARLSLHLLAGGGIVKNESAGGEVRLQSNYRFNLLAQFPFSESETVTIKFTEKAQAPAMTAGAGLTLNLWGPLGLRADARVLATKNTTVTTVSASPTRTVATAAAQQLTFPSLTSPSIQFSSAPGARTTLSGGAVTDLETYAGRGYEVRPYMTVGLVLRF